LKCFDNNRKCFIPVNRRKPCKYLNQLCTNCWESVRNPASLNALRETICYSCRQFKDHTAQKCRPLCAQNGLRIAARPRYSLNLAPSTCFLFGHVESCLHGIAFQSHDE
jgi:hypothetical protein